MIGDGIDIEDGKIMTGYLRIENRLEFRGEFIAFWKRLLISFS